MGGRGGGPCLPGFRKLQLSTLIVDEKHNVLKVLGSLESYCFQLRQLAGSIVPFR